MNISDSMKQDLKNSLEIIYHHYGTPSSEISTWENIRYRVWNAVKHIFNQSDWQIASKRLATIIVIDGDKNEQNFSGIVFPGLRENVFSHSEAREIADHFLNLVTEEEDSSFRNTILSARDRLDQCAGKVLYKKAVKNPTMFPKLDLKDANFLTETYHHQLETIFHSARNGSAGFRELGPLLYDIANDDL